LGIATYTAGLYRGVLEKNFQDRCNCNLEMCFRAHSGKRPASTTIPEGSARSRRSSHPRIGQIRTKLNCHENAEAARNELKELGDLAKWIDSFESSTEWNRLISARKSNSARERTKPKGLRSLRDLPKNPPARHVWILEELTHKSAEEANQQANIHPVEDSDDGRMDSDGVHEEEVAVKTVMVESAEGNLEEDTQPPFPKVRDTGTGNRMNGEGGQLLDPVHLDRHGVLVHTTPSIAVSTDGINKTHRETDEEVDPVLPGNLPEIKTITADEVARV
jgi:hypothetical protein